jgi:hypothetical protein
MRVWSGFPEGLVRQGMGMFVRMHLEQAFSQVLSLYA